MELAKCVRVGPPQPIGRSTILSSTYDLEVHGGAAERGEAEMEVLFERCPGPAWEPDAAMSGPPGLLDGLYLVRA